MWRLKIKENKTVDKIKRYIIFREIEIYAERSHSISKMFRTLEKSAVKINRIYVPKPIRNGTFLFKNKRHNSAPVVPSYK